MNETQLRDLFKNMSDCYADTWKDGIEGDVIPAMTEDKFIELFNIWFAHKNKNNE
jgi:hypothetical protein